jgi:D-sedoheptulose 7-phosphate isomerase
MNSVPHATSPLQKAAAEAAALCERLPEIERPLQAIAEACATALRHGNKILFCGNGGSAAECQHLATEFVVRLSALRERRALPSIALTTDTSLLTACANDYGFDRIFARQVEALMEPGDVLILLSTSGKSPNLIEAAKMARLRNGMNISFVGETPTPLDPLSDHVLHIPSPASQRVQEGHLLCGHVLVELVESLLFDADEKSTAAK